MKKVLLLTFLLSNIYSSEALTEEQKMVLENEAMHKMMQKIWTEAMEAKEAYQNGLFNIREEYLENVCSTAPEAMNFSINADVYSVGSEVSNVYAELCILDECNTYDMSLLSDDFATTS